MRREPDEAQNSSGPPGMPTWLKVSGSVVAVIFIVVIVVLLLDDGGGGHGPGRHGAEGTATQDAPTSAVALG